MLDTNQVNLPKRVTEASELYGFGIKMENYRLNDFHLDIASIQRKITTKP